MNKPIVAWIPDWTKNYSSISDAEADLIDFEFKGDGWYMHGSGSLLAIEDLGVLRVAVWEFVDAQPLMQKISDLPIRA